MTDQPISKEERRLEDVARKLAGMRRPGGGSYFAWQEAHDELASALAALDRARTPPKPKTIEERLNTFSFDPSMRAHVRYVHADTAASIAREFALEEMERILAACEAMRKNFVCAADADTESQFARGKASGVGCFKHDIQRLISEARGR